MESDTMEKNNSEIKVHATMCMTLNDILKKVGRILPAIESARPGSRLGIQELCSLNLNVEKGKLLIQHCTESSKLYLAMTSETTLLRCERIRSSLCQSLCLIQTMVPTLLATQIVEIIDYINDVKFSLNPSDEEAGKSLLELLRQTDSVEEHEFETFQFVASKLSLTTPKSILIEKRSLKKLLQSVSGGKESKKEGILTFFLYLIKKYGQNPNPNSTKKYVKKEVKLNASNYASQHPLEFLCPISSKLMQDPVIISSGQTYERENIEKWFEEGNDTCPKTKVKLANLTIIPNSSMRDLIASWRKKHFANKSQPNQLIPGEIEDEPQSNLTRNNMESKRESFSLSEALQSQYSTSSLKDLSTPMIRARVGNIMFQKDHSNASFISSDASYISESSRYFNETEDLNEKLFEFFPWSEDFQKYGSFCKFDKDMFAKFLLEASQLELEVQKKAIEEFKMVLNGDEESCYNFDSSGVLEALIEFLKYNRSDLDIGIQMFLAFLSNSRVDIPFINDEVLDLFSSLLETKVKYEALLVLEKLTNNPNFISKITESNLIVLSLIQLLQTKEEINLQEQLLKILSKISNQIQDLNSQIFSPNFISKLSSLLSEENLSLYCITILSNLRYKEEILNLIISTDGCLASICELLETESHQEQDCSLNILMSICSKNDENCFLVMNEGIIPALVDLSVNGSEEGKGNASKLLFLLRDLRYNNSNNNDGDGVSNGPGNNNDDDGVSNGSGNRNDGDGVSNGSGSNNDGDGVSNGSGLSSPTEYVSEMVINKEEIIVEKTNLKSSSGFFTRTMRFFSKPRR